MTGLSIKYFGVVPLLALLIIVIFIPTIYAFVISLQDYRLGYPIQYVGLRNYSQLLRDPWFWRSVRLTFIFTASALALELFLGMGIAVLLSKGFPLQNLWLAILIAPFAVSPVVAVAVWKYMFTTDGLINYVLSCVGLGQVRWLSNPTYAFVAMLLINIWLNYPFSMVIFYAAIKSLPREYVEAACLDGANSWQIFLRIILPLITPAALVALTFRLIIIFRTFEIPWLLTQGGPLRGTELLSVYLYRQGFRHWDFGIAAAVSWVVLMLTLFLSCFWIREMYKKTVY